MSRSRLIVLIAVPLVLLLAVAEYVLFESSGVPDEGKFELDLKQVREMAGRTGLPLRINSMVVSNGTYPDIAVRSGGTFFREQLLVNVVYQVMYADQSVILDAANDKALHDEWSNGEFFQDRYDDLQEALLRSGAVYFTHEHFDHIGGISKSANMDRLKDRVHLTREQLDGPTLEWAMFPEGSLEGFTPLSYEKYHVAGPGIVLIKAPGHTAGTQMIYVRLADGREYLFAGDIGWNMDNIRQLRGKAGLAAMMATEDRSLVGLQLRRLKEIVDAGQVQVVVSHDPDQLQSLRDRGLLGAAFE